MKILVSGFKPYATHPVNTSEVVLGNIHRDNVVKLLLPVEYDKAREMIKEAIAKEKPDAVLILALSPFVKRPILEQYGYNEMDSVQEDEAHVVKTREVIVEGAPKSLIAGFDIPSIQQYILSQGEKCDISIDPGRFVANAVYFEALNTKVPTILFHLPQQINYPMEDSAESVDKIFDYLDY